MLARIKKLTLCLALPLALVGLLPAPASAWGPAGHRIVALVAARHLDATPRAEVKRLLGDETLADVANWADDVREEKKETAPWHYVNLPDNAAGFVRSRDCTDEKGRCAVWAIEHFTGVLADKSKPDAARAEALKYVVHFVGDLHQPLHVGFASDKGGNNVKLLFFNRKSNLHKVWDSGIIGRAGLGDDEFAAALEAALHDFSGEEEFATASATTSAKITQIQGGTPETWANQSFAIVRGKAYAGIPQSKKIGVNYYEANWQVVDDQLTAAGLRLARIINAALD